MGLVMILILLFAIFFFFDIHNVIRGKMKLETAEQAAALAAARWQAESLNLIGEINLLIATENVLLSENITVPDTDIFKDNAEDGEDILENKKYARGHARVLALNEMQSRITFIGPLLALAAAQQTAKNNGINPVKESGDHDEPRNVADDFEQYQRRLNSDNNIYTSGNNLNINGYAWKEPYKILIREIQSNGIAVRPNAMVVGIEGLQPAFLGDASLYSAIIACSKGYPAWCHWRLRQLIKEDDSFFENWPPMPDFSFIRFSQQSEIYPLELELRTDLTSEYENFQLYGTNFGKDLMGLNEAMRYRSRFYHYNHRWHPNERTYTGPEVDRHSPWRRGIFLRKNIKPAVLYGGAVAYAECVEHIPGVMQFKSSYNQTQAKNLFAGKAHLETEKSLVKEFKTSKVQVGGNYSVDLQNSGCVAKPIGEFSPSASLRDASGDAYDSTNPVTIPLVLPVFNKVNLIPGSLQKVRIFSFKWPPVEQFVVALKDWLDKGNSIYDDNFVTPDGTNYMLEALRLLGTKEFRKKGYNHDFKAENLTGAELIKLFDRETRLYDPVKNPQGPGWLQQPMLHYGRNYKLPKDATEMNLYYYTAEIANELNKKIEEKMKENPNYQEAKYIVPPEDETWLFYNGQYIRMKGNTFFDNMEKDPYDGCGVIPCRCGQVPCQCKGGISSGTNTGPARL